MTVYGLTSTGYIIKPLDIILAEVEAALKDGLGASINLLPETVLGNLKNIFSEREYIIWEGNQLVHNSAYPDTAFGVALDNAVSLNNIIRLAATKSAVLGVALFGTATTVIPAGTLFYVSGSPDLLFETDTEVTIGAGTDEVQDIDFSGVPTSGSFKLVYKAETTAAIQWDDTNTEVQAALNALDGLSGVTVAGNYSAGLTVTFAGSDGKQPQPALTYTDNTLDDGGAITIAIVETTPGVYQQTVNCTATVTGPIAAPAETLTGISTPIAGLDSVINPEKEITGRNIETDQELKIRRLTRLGITQSATLEGIKNAVLAINDDDTEPVKAVAVFVFENYTKVTSPDGLPPSSFEVVVYQTSGSTDRDQDIADAILGSHPVGIESYGLVELTAEDSDGVSHTVKFSRPTDVPIHTIVDLTVNSNYPVDGDDQVKAAIVAYGSALNVGDDVLVYKMIIAVGAIDGIDDVDIKIGESDPPTLSDNIAIENREIATFATANIDVNS